ncbi:MAG: hypothetical protein V3V00_04655 [Saprospiraceae bacterium]
MYLIFDTSTAGKPKTYKADISKVSNWPRIMHISWILLGEDLKPIEDHNYLITPDDYTINEKLIKNIHVETDEFNNNGNELPKVLEKLMASSDKAQYIFAHNLKLNGSIVGAECYRNAMGNFLAHKESYCLMHEATFYCKLEGKRGGYKWPSLQEMHTTIFKQGFSPSGNARADVIAASRCFIALKKAGAFEDIFFSEEV